MKLILAAPENDRPKTSAAEPVVAVNRQEQHSRKRK